MIQTIKQNIFKILIYARSVKRVVLIGVGKGQLHPKILIKLAASNLLHQKSRTTITMGAMAIGMGAIVFLMSFGYGLQKVVNERLIQPNALRLADVQSDSTALVLNNETLDRIENIQGVEDLAVSISLAGSAKVDNSRTDVVVVATDNEYLNYAHVNVTDGELFSEEALDQSLAQCIGERCGESLQGILNDIEASAEADVLGEFTTIAQGDRIHNNKVRFRIQDETYIPIHTRPSIDSSVIGYARGSILKTYQAYEVWGSTYESTDTKGRYHQTADGSWYGKWFETEVPMYEKIAETHYVPMNASEGGLRKGSGYIPQLHAHVLSEDDLLLERQLQELLAESNVSDGDVLAEATESGTTEKNSESTGSDGDDATASGDLDSLVTVVGSEAEGTDEAELKDIVAQNTTKEKDTDVSFGVLEVSKKQGNEMILSTHILNTLERTPEDMIGKTIDLEYIISGGSISGITGRVVTEPVTYTVVGIIEEDSQPIMYVPLPDVQSIGVERFTQGKVLAASNEQLDSVREKIESIGFTTSSIVDTLEQVNRLFRVMRFLLGAFGLIALIVAIFGMFNTMTVSLLERTREVGVMKTIGTTDTDIVRLFMSESVIIGVVGGAMGIAFGYLLGKLIAFGLYTYSGTSATLQIFHLPFGFVVGAFIASFIVGFLTGVYPALRARSISALDALRYE